MNTETDEMHTEADSAPEEPKATWERREEFRIVGEMRKVVNLTIDATEHEIAALRRKLDKLTYGG